MGRLAELLLGADHGLAAVCPDGFALDVDVHGAEWWSRHDVPVDPAFDASPENTYAPRRRTRDEHPGRDQ